MAKIKLNVKKLNIKRAELGWTKGELAKRIGISITTLYRASLPIEDPHHDNPGEKFITGLLNAIPGAKFEEYFFLK